MSLTCYFLLLNRGRFESEVSSLVDGVLRGRTGRAIEVLRQQCETVATTLDVPPLTFFQRRVQFAIDVLEGRVRTAFVNELSPLITEDMEAWKHHVNAEVRGALALSICTERPGSGFAPVLDLSSGEQFLIGKVSVTAGEVCERDSPELIEFATVGIFQSPEGYLRGKAVQSIVEELEPVVRGVELQVPTDPTFPPATLERRKRVARHLYELAVASVEKPGFAVLRGYL